MEKPLFTKVENLLRTKFLVKLLTLLLVFFGSLDSLFALQYANVINFNKEQYNANSKNWSISHAGNGVMYIGNNAGLLQFDGIHWNLYPMPNETKVRSVLVASNQRIYVGAYEEFGYWEEDSFGQLHYTSLSNSLVDFELHNEDIWKIVEDEDGKIHFQSFSVVFTFDGTDLTFQRLDNPIIFLLKARNKTIAQVTRNNLVEFSGGKLEEIPESELLNKAFTRVFLPYKDDAYLLGSIKQGLTLWKDGKFQNWNCPAQDSLAGKEINRGVYDGTNYYIGTIQDGVYVINENGEVLAHLNTQNYLENNTVLGMDLDDQGRLWLALNKGISCIDFNYPLQFITERKADIGVVNAAALYKNDFYLGTNQGVYRCKGGGKDVTKLSLKDFSLLPESSGHVWSLREIDGQLLCGHNNGTFRIEGDKLIRISRIGGAYNFQKLEVKNTELLIQSTYTNLVLFKKNEKGMWSFFRRLRGFQEPSRFISVDPFGNIWVNHSHKKEIYKMRFSEHFRQPLIVQKYGKNKGLPSDLGFHVFEFYNRIVFTSKNGIYTYDDLKDTILPYQKLNQSLGEFISSHKIIKGNNDGYWFVKPRKLALFAKENDGFTKKVEFLLTESNHRLVEDNENIVLLNDNETLICLDNGYAVFKGDTIVHDDSQKHVFFNEILSNSKARGEEYLPRYLKEAEVRIPYNGNSIEFRYSSLASPGKTILFQTKLEGLDTDWSMPSDRSEMQYSRLPWGNYTFKVKGQDEFGYPLPVLSYPFEIRPPWYATNWAIFVFALIGLILVVFVPLGIRRYYRKQREIYQKEQQRILIEKQEEERLKADQKMIKLRNENLRNELSHKSSELANSTMSIIRKNAVLLDIKEEILKQKEELKQRYPAKYLERVIKLIDKNIDNQDDWEIFEKHFDRAHVDFFNRLKNNYPDLTPKDLRLCAYLKMNLTTKEIAPLLNISPRSVEVHRYRLRKKLDFSSSDNLNEFMIQF